MRRDAGETLLEILITIVILGIGVVALMGSLMMAVRGSGQVGGHTALQATMRSYADALTNVTDVAPSPSSSTNPQRQYVTCRLATAFPAPAAVGVTLPSGMSISVTKVEYWYAATSTTPTPSASAGWRLAGSGGCTTSGTGIDFGAQRVTLTGTQATGAGPAVTDTLTFVIRRPCKAIASVAPTATPTSGAC